jgi:hypothetical protein
MVELFANRVNLGELQLFVIGDWDNEVRFAPDLKDTVLVWSGEPDEL